VTPQQAHAKYSRIGYCAGTHYLIVELRDGSAKKFREVSRSTWARLKQARSKTEFIRRELGPI
jgi:predicted NUDIX family NTP pyrophosphohydrolase